MSEAATVPVTVAGLVVPGGHGLGFVPPPQNQKTMPPATFGCPKWTWAIAAGLFSPEEVSVNDIVLSGLIVRVRFPVPFVWTAGVSSCPFSDAVKTVPLSWPLPFP